MNTISKIELSQMQKLLTKEQNIIAQLKEFNKFSDDPRLKILYQQTTASHINYFKSFTTLLDLENV